MAASDRDHLSSVLLTLENNKHPLKEDLVRALQTLFRDAKCVEEVYAADFPFFRAKGTHDQPLGPDIMEHLVSEGPREINLHDMETIFINPGLTMYLLRRLDATMKRHPSWG